MSTVIIISLIGLFIKKSVRHYFMLFINLIFLLYFLLISILIQLVVLVGSIVKRYDAENIDIIFWISVVFTFVVLLFIWIIVTKISDKTKEIKDL